MISTVQSLKHYQCFQQYKVSRWKVGRGWLISNPQTLLYFPGGKKKIQTLFVLLFSNKQCLKIILSVKNVNCKAHEEPVLALLHKSLGKNSKFKASLRYLSPSSPFCSTTDQQITKRLPLVPSV